MDVDKALQTQLGNIEKKTGKSLAELTAILKGAGLAKHGQLRDFAKAEFNLGYGDANTLVTVVLAADAAAPTAEHDPLDAIYAGPKALLRPIHAKLIDGISGFGPFETAPKKTYVSLRRKKQFAMIGPATNTRVELGLNGKNLRGDERLEPLPPGGMCNYRIRLTEAAQVDEAMLAVVRQAYDAAG
ncbi:MAG: DUF4287 domain-containing protein [Acidobacteria bacterium]|nr:DUF4287 domain-containing protein [Acidobacteriota bacterium]